MFSAPALFTWNLRALRQLGGGSRKAQGENSSVGFRVLGLVDFLVNGASLEAQRNRVKVLRATGTTAHHQKRMPSTPKIQEPRP